MPLHLESRFSNMKMGIEMKAPMESHFDIVAGPTLEIIPTAIFDA